MMDGTGSMVCKSMLCASCYPHAILLAMHEHIQYLDAAGSQNKLSWLYHTASILNDAW